MQGHSLALNVSVAHLMTDMVQLQTVINHVVGMTNKCVEAPGLTWCTVPVRMLYMFTSNLLFEQLFSHGRIVNFKSH